MTPATTQLVTIAATRVLREQGEPEAVVELVGEVLPRFLAWAIERDEAALEELLMGLAESQSRLLERLKFGPKP